MTCRLAAFGLHGLQLQASRCLKGADTDRGQQLDDLFQEHWRAKVPNGHSLEIHCNKDFAQIQFRSCVNA